MAAAAAMSNFQLCGGEHERNARELAICEVNEDRDHLQGFSFPFACKVDLISCAHDANASLVGLPIHKDPISTYSPVILQLLEVQRSSSIFDQQSFHLHLLKDIGSSYSSSAMHAAVSYLYPQSSGKSQPSTLSMD